MKLPENRTVTSVAVDLTNLDTAFQDQKIRSLLSDGYRIATVITATDDGRPLAFFIFEPISDPAFAIKAERWNKAAVVLLALNAAICAAILLTYLQHP